MLVWNRPALLFISLRLAAGAMGHGPKCFRLLTNNTTHCKNLEKIAKTYGALRQGPRWAPMGQPLKKTTAKIVVAKEIIEQVKEFYYLGSMISDDATEKSREGSNSGVNLVWNLGVVDPGKKSISTGKFPKNFNFFRQFYKRISSFAGKFPKILIFSGN